MMTNIVAVVTAHQNLSDPAQVFDTPGSLWEFLSDSAVKNDRDFEDIDSALFISKNVFKEADGNVTFVTFFDDDCEDRCFENRLIFKITTAHIK